MIPVFNIKNYLIIALSFVIVCLGFYPGTPNPDALGQYSEALAGIYSDHHPAVMAFVWRYVNLIFPGIGSMFVIPLILYCIGSLILLRCSEYIEITQDKIWPAILLALTPWFPHVIFYIREIQKDNLFTFSYFLICCYLALKTIKKEKPRFFSLLLITLGLIYGTSVKYQAQFCLPFLVFWLTTLLSSSILKRVMFSATLLTTIYGSIFAINSALVPASRQSNSWQYVKLFDLASISRDTYTDLIPDAFKTEFYNFERLKDEFTPNLVDPYVFPQNAILKKSQIKIEQEMLWSVWAQEITAHPFLYIKHRLRNLGHCFLGRAGFTQVHAFMKRYPADQSAKYFYANKIVDGLGYVFFTQFATVLIGLLYFILGLRFFGRFPSAKIL